MTATTKDVHRDRSFGLAVFGGVQILIGLACAALIPLTLVGVALSPMMETGIVVSSLILYAVGAAIFITLLAWTGRNLGRKAGIVLSGGYLVYIGAVFLLS